MPVDENTRLRIRQYLIELMDEGAADAMMESMPPIPWTELATKDDIARLDDRLVGIDGRIDSLTERVDGTNTRIDSVADRLDGTNTRIDTIADRLDGTNTRIDTIADRLDGTNTRIDTIADRLDGTNERLDTTNERMADLSRAVTVGFFSMALTLAVFLIGTIASLIAAGAFS